MLHTRLRLRFNINKRKRKKNKENAVGIHTPQVNREIIIHVSIKQQQLGF
jgi:hypothetical protein